MKILLVGEFSRLHNSLKEGLQKLNHEVFLYGFNDGFKDFPIDLKLEKKFDKGFLKKIKLGIPFTIELNLLSSASTYDSRRIFSFSQFSVMRKRVLVNIFSISSFLISGKEGNIKNETDNIISEQTICDK